MREGGAMVNCFSKVLIQGMYGVTKRASLNWLFGVSCMLLMLSSCICEGSDSISWEVIESLM